jgi:hypothetical protein
MKIKIYFIALMFFSQIAYSQELKRFLQSCGYGTLGGAGLGLASLVFEKKPNESYGNIARGASLGLYGGIAYGLFSMKQESKSSTSDIVENEETGLYYVIPTIDGRIETLMVFRF